MFIGIVEGEYSSIRLFEILLKQEGHTTRSFGRFEQLERSQEAFDLLLINPGMPTQAPYVFQKLTRIQTSAKRIIHTTYEEVLLMTRKYPGMKCLLIPFKRNMLLALINELNIFEVASHEAGED